MSWNLFMFMRCPLVTIARSPATIVLLLILVNRASAQNPIILAEPGGRSYSVRATVEVTGTLTLPAEKGKAAPPAVGISGRSTVAYDERPLSPMPDGAVRTVRFYRQAEFRRVVAGKNQESTLRPGIRRMVVLRRGSREVPFSPDGPLMFGEIDLVRTDVFTPALSGLLPTRPVRLQDRWPATAAVIEELTDLERIEEGTLECRLTAIAGRTATVTFSGNVRGVNEDGPVRQQLDGTLSFDLDAGLITGLNLTGIKTLLDGQGRPTGRVEGRFSLTRQTSAASELTDAALRGIVLEPNSANTLLVYEGSNVAFRFNYSRRWRVSAEQGRQVTLEDNRGNGLLLTAEPAEKIPSSVEYLAEATAVVAKQKGRVTDSDPPAKLRPYPLEVERFGMNVEIDKQPARMEYAIVRQAAGGATLAARLIPADVGVLAPEVEEIAKSIRIGPPAPAGVIPLPQPGK